MLARSIVLVFIAHCLLIISESHQIHELNAKCRDENNLKEEKLLCALCALQSAACVVCLSSEGFNDEVSRLNETRHLETADEKIKCFIKCILTGLKLMNEEGELTLDDVSEKRMKYKKHFPTCKNVTGTDSCDKALNFQNCIWKEIDAEEKSAQ